jgi:hypothetical protein
MMAKPKSPATILNFLKVAKGAYQQHKPDPKSKAETRHKEIVKDLQRLKVMAAQKPASGARLAAPFEARKRLLLRKVTVHRKKLNSPAEQKEDPNKPHLAAYVKKLLKLTVAVLGLDFATVTAAEESLDLNALEEGNPAELDALDTLTDAEAHALESADNLDLPESGDGEEGPAHTEAPADAGNGKPTAPSGIEILKKFLALKGPFDQAVARKGPDVPQLQALFERIRGLLDHREFAQAAPLLPELETLIARGQAAGPAAGGKAVVGWQAARVEATHTLRQLETLVAKTKHPLAGETVALIENMLKRLPPEIKTKEQAVDLARYLETDSDVSDLEDTPVEGTTYSIRPALVKALQALQEQLPA